MCAMDSLVIPSQNILYTAINNLKYLHIMQTTIKIPFGYNTFSIGSHSIHTLKIRVKSSCNDLHTRFPMDIASMISFTETDKNCTLFTTMQFITSDYVEHISIRNAINKVLAEIMHERIDAKYGIRNHTKKYIDYDLLIETC